MSWQGFEDNIRKNRTVISNWIKYAQWEESLKEIQRYSVIWLLALVSLLLYLVFITCIYYWNRARSIYERALDVDHRNITLWLKYAEMEMKNRQVNHARNIWDRAITILPRVSQFWYVSVTNSHCLLYAYILIIHKIVYSTDMLMFTRGKKWAWHILFPTLLHLIYIVMGDLKTMYSCLLHCFHLPYNALPWAGTSTHTWRRCWGMLQAAGRCLSAGWSGSQKSKLGTPTLTSSCDIRKWRRPAPSMSNISFGEVCGVWFQQCKRQCMGVFWFSFSSYE